MNEPVTHMRTCLPGWHNGNSSAPIERVTHESEEHLAIKALRNVVLRDWDRVQALLAELIAKHDDVALYLAPARTELRAGLIQLDRLYDALSPALSRVMTRRVRQETPGALLASSHGSMLPWSTATLHLCR